MMTDFMERARAEAERRWETYSDAAGGADVFDKPSFVVGFLGGARWARDVLLADPTDAEMTTEYVYGIEWRGERYTEKVIEWYSSESDAITDFNDRSVKESPSLLVRARLSDLEVLHGGSPLGPEGYDDFCYERPRDRS